MSEEEARARYRYLQLKAKIAGSAPAPETKPAPAPAGISAKQVASKALDYGLRGLDYIGGLSRTGAYTVADEVGELLGREDSIDSGDALLSALKGQAPSSSEYLKKMGIENPTAAAALGFVSDIALDPLTYLSLGSTALGKGVAKAATEKGAKGLLGKVGKAGLTVLDPSDAIGALGSKIYKGGFGSIDQELAAKGVRPISEALEREGKIVTSEGARKATNEMRLKAGARLGDIYKGVDDVGVTVLPKLDNAYKTIANMRKDKNLVDVADSLEAWVKNYDPLQGGAKLGVQEAANIKTQLRSTIPTKAFTPAEFGGSVLLPGAKKAQGEVAGAFDEAIKSIVPSKPMLEETLAQYATATNAIPLLNREAKKAARKKGISVVDAALGGAAFGGVMGENQGLSAGGATALGTKKLAEAANTTLGRTLLGLGTKGSRRITGSILRRQLSDLGRNEENGNGNE